MGDDIIKEQHIVPQTYLQHFVTNKDRNIFTSGEFVRSPKPQDDGKTIIKYRDDDSPNVFSKKTFYYETKDKDDNIIENLNLVEKSFWSLENKYNDAMKPIFDLNKEVLTNDSETVCFCYDFFAMLFLRTYFFIELLQNMSYLFAKRIGYDDVVSDEVGLIAGKQAFTNFILRDDLGKQLRRCFNSMTVCKAPDEMHFFTNDNPVSPRLKLFGTHIFVPVSTTVGLKFHRKLIPAFEIKCVDKKFVDKINAEMVISANEKFLLTNGKIKDNIQIAERAFEIKQQAKKQFKTIYNDRFIANILVAILCGDKKSLTQAFEQASGIEKIIIIAWIILSIPFIRLTMAKRK